MKDRYEIEQAGTFLAEWRVFQAEEARVEEVIYREYEPMMCFYHGYGLLI